LVSVGTGSAAAVHPNFGPSKATLAFNARKIPLLQEIGRRTATKVDLDSHFTGFL